MTPVEELLLESAPLARRTAQELCRRDPRTGESCAWIHGLWPYLRLLGLASTPEQHAEFFERALNDVLETRHSRVLVSGAADHSMLAVVIRACRERDAAPAITVVDRCETPLTINRWYAHRLGIDVATSCRDMLEYVPSEPFDALCTHSFLSELPAEQWPSLFSRWRECLRPGGAVITANRLRPSAGGGGVGFTREEARVFSDAVLQRAEALRAVLKLDPTKLANEAEIYIERRRISAVRSREEFVALFEDSGFRIQELACGPVTAQETRHDIGGPTTPGGAEYARVVAVRR
jgi:hypothetical protein